VPKNETHVYETDAIVVVTGNAGTNIWCNDDIRARQLTLP